MSINIASFEIRKIAVTAYLSSKATQQQLADILDFHMTAIVRWVRECGKDEKLAPNARSHMPAAFSLEEKEDITAMVRDKPDITLEEIRTAFQKIVL